MSTISEMAVATTSMAVVDMRRAQRTTRETFMTIWPMTVRLMMALSMMLSLKVAFGIEGVTMSMSVSSSSKGADDSKEMVDETQSSEGDKTAEDYEADSSASNAKSVSDGGIVGGGGNGTITEGGGVTDLFPCLVIWMKTITMRRARPMVSVQSVTISRLRTLLMTEYQTTLYQSWSSSK